MSFDKGYVYTFIKNGTDQGSFYVTRLNENAKYEVTASSAAKMPSVSSTQRNFRPARYL